MTTTREAQLESALRSVVAHLEQDCTYLAEDVAKAAIAPPPDTHSAGYVAGLEAALSVIKKVPYDFHQSAYAQAVDAVASLILAARPAPQPAADTRVVAVTQLEAWHRMVDGEMAEEICKIIGENGQ